MKDKPLYSYTEKEFVDLNNEKIENLIMKMILISDKNSFKYKYLKSILNDFQDNKFTEKSKKEILYKKLFDRSKYLKKESFKDLKKREDNIEQLIDKIKVDEEDKEKQLDPKSKGKLNFKRYLRIAKDQYNFSLFLSVIFAFYWINNVSQNNYFFEFILVSVIGSLLSFMIIQWYFFPTNIANARKHPNKLAIFMINIFGGLGLPWIIALIWSISNFNNF